MGEEAEKNAADGQVSLPEARNLWKMAQDGGKVTATELRTLKYILEKLKFTGPAKKFLQAEVDKIAEPKEDEEEKEAGEEAERRRSLKRARMTKKRQRKRRMMRKLIRPRTTILEKIWMSQQPKRRTRR